MGPSKRTNWTDPDIVFDNNTSAISKPEDDRKADIVERMIDWRQEQLLAMSTLFQLRYRYLNKVHNPNL